MVYKHLQLVHVIIFHKLRAINTYVTAHNTCNWGMYPWRVDAVKLYLAATWFRLMAGTIHQKSIATHCLRSGNSFKTNSRVLNESAQLRCHASLLRYIDPFSRHKPCVFSNNPHLFPPKKHIAVHSFSHEEKDGSSVTFQMFQVHKLIVTQDICWKTTEPVIFYVSSLPSPTTGARPMPWLPESSPGFGPPSLILLAHYAQDGKYAAPSDFKKGQHMDFKPDISMVRIWTKLVWAGAVLRYFASVGWCWGASGSQQTQTKK